MVKTHTISASALPGETGGAAAARMMLKPSTTAAATLACLDSVDGAASTLMDYARQLDAIGDKAVANDLEQAERMLIAQAATLDSIFNTLTQWGINGLRAGKLKSGETYLRLALKAQSQARTSVESLAVIKNPPQAIFARQANIAAGHQQVNNGVSGAREIAEPSPPNKLLEASNGERLDTGATSATSGANPILATVEPIYRTANGRG